MGDLASPKLGDWLIRNIPHKVGVKTTVFKSERQIDISVSADTQEQVSAFSLLVSPK